MTDLNALLERVKAATGPDRGLDADLLEMANIGYYDYTRSNYEYQADDANRMDLTKEWWHPFPTRTIDAALALTERVLPGWIVVNLCEWDAEVLRARGPWTCILKLGGTQDDFRAPKGRCNHAPTAPLAIIAATLAALIASEPKS